MQINFSVIIAFKETPNLVQFEQWRLQTLNIQKKKSENKVREIVKCFEKT